MMNNGIFDMIVKPINDVWQKTEETTRIILVPINAYEDKVFA